jgi:hypothetical protein
MVGNVQILIDTAEAKLEGYVPERESGKVTKTGAQKV